MADTPQEMFELWFARPLQVLEGIEGGSGAFIALSTSMFLYERYFNALKGTSPPKNISNEISEQLAYDLSTEKEATAIFLDMARNGLLHQGMFLQGGRRAYPKYTMSGTYKLAVELIKDPPELRINPWTIVHRIVELWRNNLDLFDSSKSFPVAKRFRVQYHYFTSDPGRVEMEFIEEP